MPTALAPGDVVIVHLPEHVPPGHEQIGSRPAIIVGLPDSLGTPRFPVVLVSPLTTDRGQDWAGANLALYPRIPAGSGGLPSDSLALLDQLRAVDVSRIGGYLGTLTEEAYRPI